MKKQHLFAFFLALAMVVTLGVFNTRAQAATVRDSGTCGDNVKWSLDEDDVLTISGVGAMKDYSSNNLPWADYKSQITEVVIKSGVTSVGQYAFYHCTALKSVTIPSTVTSIGRYAFEGCTGLKSVSIPGSVATIGYEAFYNCTALTSVTLGNGVQTIGGNAFYNCYSLKELTTPKSLTSIGSSAFYGCSAMKTLSIQGAAAIGSSAFKNCSHLTTLTLSESVSQIGAYAFEECTRLRSVAIPDSVTALDNFAFKGCTNLTSVTLGKGLEKIGQYAFKNCTNLEKITIPGNISVVGYEAFYGCKSLTSVTMESGVTEIGHNAFYECTNLSSLSIPQTVTSIGGCAFYRCESLTTVTIPDNLTSMSSNAFNYCSSLESVIIGKRACLGEWAFSYCTSLKNVTIGDKVTAIPSHAFYGCTALQSITIPDYVTRIGQAAFGGCTGLTSVSVGNSVTSIGYQAFYNCVRLTNLTIGESVTSIDSYAFYCCTGLTSVVIPDSVTTIEAYAFDGCNGLTSVTIGENVDTIGQSAFSNCVSLKDVYYTSDEADWDMISIGTNNHRLTNATIHYNCVPLAVTKQPGTQRIKADATAKFSVSASGNGLKYQWQYRTSSSGEWKNSGADSAKTSTFSVKGTTARNGYQYRCKITDADGKTVYSGTATLYVLGIKTQPSTTSVKVDATAKFTVKATGDSLKYQWQYRTSSSGSWKNSGASSATTKTFSVKGTTGRNGYQYRCKVTDSAGNTVYSKTVTLYVLGITTQPKTTTVANNATAKFTVKATGNSVKYQWQYRTSSSGSWKNSGASSATTKTFSVKGTSDRNGYQYRCKLTDSAGNVVYSNTVTLKVSACTITSQPKSVTTSAGSTAKFTVKTSGSGLKFQWQYRTSSTGSWKNSGASSATSKTFSVKATNERSGYQYRCKITDANGNVIYTNTVTLKVN